MKYLNAINCFNQIYLVLFKLFIYANKVSFNVESRIELVLQLVSALDD